ncbi:hypothetical protein FOZG_17964 [Fusarium oxysporum Fo47]|uniref:Uncharacterized protein n=1 Tax=Fusarium oxysporum Fo47 TaxID=660027 RepID=W9JFT8_FUSOX|nr:hypothetical protein FOZG_17964 [Fusarium oxysporum Fo47]
MTLAERSLRAFYSFPDLQMDANVPVNCQNPDCSAPSASPNNSDASPDDWKAFPWHKFPGFSISERAGVRHYLYSVH